MISYRLKIILKVALPALFVLLMIKVVNAQSEIEAKCWTEKQCEESGVWGKGKVYKDAVGSFDKWSIENCGLLGDVPTARCFAEPPHIPLQIYFPGLDRRCVDLGNNKISGIDCAQNSRVCSNGQVCRPIISGGFPGYFKLFYQFFIAALAVASVVMIMWAGFKRIMAAGNQETISESNKAFFGALIGFVLALTSYSLLQLINPQLVTNTLAVIEAVRPEYYGSCPTYGKAENTYRAGYRVIECRGGTRNGEVCHDDSDCPGGSCGAGETLYNQTLDTCGKRVVLNGKECTGIECSTSGMGCFPDLYSDKLKYSCSQYLVGGKLSGNEINYVDLLPICNDGRIPIGSGLTSRDGCAVSSPNGQISNTLSVEGKGAYAIQNCWDNATARTSVRSNVCGSTGMKGYALIVEIESTGTDDWYAVDVSSCGIKTKRIHGEDDNDDPKAIAVKQLDFSKVSAASLINPDTPFNVDGSIKEPIICDLDITRDEFPDR